MLKEHYKDQVDVNIFYTDMRSGFKGYEEFFNRAQEVGVHFIRVKLDNRRIIENPETKNLTVCAETEEGKPVKVETEMVVLANASIPAVNSKELAKMLNIPLGKDGYFAECQPKIRPIDTDVPGVFLAGACQGLKDIPYSVAQGSGVAAQAAAVLSQKAWAVEPIVARVNEDACSGCKVCESVCSYHAINIENIKGKDLAKVTEGLCRGCGICASSCPVDAITMPNYTDEQIMAQIKAVMQVGEKQ